MPFRHKPERHLLVMMKQILAVTSGKGGVGKTSICAALGHAFSAIGMKTVIVELDSGLRGLDLMLGVHQSNLDLSDIIKGRCKPVEAAYISAKSERLFLIPASTDASVVLSAQRVKQICNGLLAAFDVVILDMPAGVHTTSEILSQVSATSLMVVTPDPVCVRDAASFNTILHQKGITDLKMIINKVPRKLHKNYKFKNLDQVIDDTYTQLIGVIPYSEGFQNALLAYLPPDPSTVWGRAVFNIAHRVLGHYVPLAVQ